MTNVFVAQVEHSQRSEPVRAQALCGRELLHSRPIDERLTILDQLLDGGEGRLKSVEETNGEGMCHL